MHSEDYSSLEGGRNNNYFFPNQQENNGTIFQELCETKSSQNNNLMKNLYDSCLQLLEREIAEGNSKLALQYMETYHTCQAINQQVLNLFLYKPSTSYPERNQ